jgi:hypothetical protein
MQSHLDDVFIFYRLPNLVTQSRIVLTGSAWISPEAHIRHSVGLAKLKRFTTPLGLYSRNRDMATRLV